VAGEEVKGSPEAPVVRVKLLGAFSISVQGREAGPWARPTAKRLCELVLISPGHRASRDLACEELYPNLGAHAAARALSKALSLARSALSVLEGPAADLLQADLGHIWASPATALDIDAERHEEALRSALAMEPGQARDDRFVAALADEGTLLADEPYTDWASGPRERLDVLRQRARLTLARDRARGAGRRSAAAVTEAWESCLEHDAGCEEAAAALMRAYASQGLRHLVVRTYESCRTALQELALRTSPALDEVHAAAIFDPAPSRGPATPSPAGAMGGAARVREGRKVVSALFAEATGPQGMANQADPEDLREALGEALARVITEVEGLGGTVTSVSGGGLQALFGVPVAHEDDPERATRAAWRALAAAPGPGRELATLRIGVETGPAVVGPVGAGAQLYGAVGEVVGAAAALQSVAMAGSILVGPVTRAATEGLFEWGATEEVALGQDVKPLLASRLERPKARAAGRQRRPGGQVPTVGRQDELGVLFGALRQALSGQGSVVVLVGEPGLGKTRLVQDCRKRFMAWVGARTGRLPLWLEGRAASYASSTPYGLYQQLLGSWVGVAPDQDEAVVRPALERALLAAMGNQDLLPLLARMMGLTWGTDLVRLGPEELQRATFAALRSLVDRLVAAGPTVLVLEDLHWADPISLRLTAELAALAADSPLLVLATARPEARAEVATLEAAIGARVTRHRVELGPLPDDAERELARSLVGDVAAEDVFDAVRGGVDGNPLFLEERFSSLVETGVLVRQERTWRLGAGAGAEVPQLLERLVRSRVDRLSPSTQDVVFAASVLGPELTLSLLTAVCGPDRALAEALDELSAKDILQEVTGGAERSYRFRHALIQEATYRGLLRAERRRLHARAAWALEASAEGRLEESANVLGRHFAAAEETERAVHYFEMAADHATAAFANDEAISSLGAALALVGQDRSGAVSMTDVAVGVRAKLAHVLWRTGRTEEAREVLGDAVRLARPTDVLRKAHLQTRLGRLEAMEDNYVAAIEAFEAATELLGEDLDEQDEARTDQWLELMVDGWAQLHLQRKEPERARVVLTAARPVLEAHGSPARKSSFYIHLAWQHAGQSGGRVDDEDVANMRTALAAASQGDDEMVIGYAAQDLGVLLLFHDDLAEAQEHLERSLAIAERIGEALMRARGLTFLALTALRRHDVEAVRSLAPQAVPACEALACPAFVGEAMACLSWLAWQDGRPGDVVTLADEALEVLARTQGWFPQLGWIALWPLVAMHLGAGHVAEAFAAGRQMLEPSQQRLPDVLERALESACAAWESDEPEVAGVQLAETLRLAKQSNYI
jgi:class 3 adenylate cyclase/tetratricopeptide (TPR) repeat protein